MFSGVDRKNPEKVHKSGEERWDDKFAHLPGRESGNIKRRSVIDKTMNTEKKKIEIVTVEEV